MRYFFFLALCVVGWTTTEAQQISRDTLTWNVERMIDMATQTETVYTCQFTTRGTASVDWIQKGGSRIYHFTVLGTDGTWTDIATDGQITYNVSYENFSGSLVFTRSNGEVTILLVLNADGQTGLNEKFIVTQS